jgi:Mrp family chromosome partitioning ATPase
VIEVNPETPDGRYLSGMACPGVAQWIAGEASMESCINPATRQLPDRICTGADADELSLMAVNMVQRLTEEARKEYDFVLIDTAPVGSSLLAEELIRQIDAVLLVSQAQQDRRPEIKAAMKIIEHLHPHTFGSVLNKVTLKREAHDTAPVLIA